MGVCLLSGKGLDLERAATQLAQSLRLNVKLTPKARREGLTGLAAAEGKGGGEGEGAVVKIAVNAPPEDGKANAALIRLLARELGVAKTAISVVAGLKDRRKLVEIRGQPAALLATLQARLNALEKT